MIKIEYLMPAGGLRCSAIGKKFTVYSFIFIILHSDFCIHPSAFNLRTPLALCAAIARGLSIEPQDLETATAEEKMSDRQELADKSAACPAQLKKAQSDMWAGATDSVAHIPEAVAYKPEMVVHIPGRVVHIPGLAGSIPAADSYIPGPGHNIPAEAAHTSDMGRDSNNTDMDVDDGKGEFQYQCPHSVRRLGPMIFQKAKSLKQRQVTRSFLYS